VRPTLQRRILSSRVGALFLRLLSPVLDARRAVR